jgi:hypothetical protein
MGKAFLFNCPTCKYETCCSLQEDRGFIEQKKPMICLNCKTLENRIIGRFESKNGGVYNEITPSCDGCGTTNNLIDWTDNQCPKCFDKLKQNPDGIMMWD